MVTGVGVLGVGAVDVAPAVAGEVANTGDEVAGMGVGENTTSVERVARDEGGGVD